MTFCCAAYITTIWRSVVIASASCAVYVARASEPDFRRIVADLGDDGGAGRV
jgi:hypothetical protein